MLLIAGQSPENQFLFGKWGNPLNHLFVLTLGSLFLLVDTSTDRVSGGGFKQVSHKENIDIVVETVLQHCQKAILVKLGTAEVCVSDEDDLGTVFVWVDVECVFVNPNGSSNDSVLYVFHC